MSKRCFAPLVLPTIYDDTLSYQELLDKVIYRLNELTEYVNGTIDEIDDIIAKDIDVLSKEIYLYVDKAKEDVLKVIDSVEKNLNDYIESNDFIVHNLSEKIDNNYDSLLDLINTKIKEVTVLIQNVEYNLKFLIAEAEQRGITYTDSKVSVEKIERENAVAVINSRIDNLILEYPEVFDPITGKAEKINRVIMDLYNGLRVLGITAITYDELCLTAEEYDSLGLTALEYDVYGGYILAEKINSMFNPFTGKRSTLKECIISIANILKPNAKTAKEYDSFGFTAEEFDSSDFNSLTQDSCKQWHSVSEDTLNKRFAYHKHCWFNENSEISEQGSVDISLPNDTIMFFVEYLFKGVLYKKTFTFNDESEICISVCVQEGVETHLYERYCLCNIEDDGSFMLVTTDCIDVNVNSGEYLTSNNELIIENVYAIYEYTCY